MSLLYASGLNSTRTAKSSPIYSGEGQRKLALMDGSPIGHHGRKGFDRNNNNDNDNEESDNHRLQYLYVLPVLLMEFLALALTRAILPSMILEKYGSAVYIVMGCADFVRGSLAFVACPLFGKLSDVVGRKTCLLITVLGTCAPVCSLAFFPWTRPVLSTLRQGQSSSLLDENTATLIAESTSEIADEASNILSFFSSPKAAEYDSRTYPVISPYAITTFIVLLSLSGIFSSTFTLVFAYISDTVKRQDERVSAYGLALATFGLSFTIGPMAGGYLARDNPQLVFKFSLLLTFLDLLYIYFILPESRKSDNNVNISRSSISIITMDHNFSWNPINTLRLVLSDPFLSKVGQVAFLYYTGLWALISTLSVYAVKQFHLTPERLGELMSALGLSTMIAEAVLVRIMVPLLGEKRSMKIGLLSFGIQCAVLGFAYEGWHLFVCAFFSLLGNLVYPSLSSLVSGSVEPDAIGEALGAVNGIKALTEGIGPLLFGTLMTWSEHTALPGWPYLIAAVLVLFAYQAANDLPDVEEDDYVHEVDKGRSNRKSGGGILLSILNRNKGGDDDNDGEEEFECLLSEIDTDDDYDNDEER